MERKIKVISIILLLLFVSFFRESFFQTVNGLIRFKGNDNPDIPVIFEFIEFYSISTLVTVKWVATLVFVLIFFFITSMMIRIFFPEQDSFTPVFIAFGGILVLSGFALLTGKIFPAAYSPAYYFSRWMLGAAQSPLLPSIICLLLLYQQKSSNKKE